MLESNPPRSLFNGSDVSAVADAVGNGPVLIAPTQAWMLAAVALSLGILADVLFNGVAPGINLPLWLLSMLAGFAFVSRRLSVKLDKTRALLFLGAFVMSASLAWRDSSTLRAFNVMAASGLLLLAIAKPSDAGLKQVSPLACLIAMYAGFVSLASTWWRLSSMLPWRVTPAYRTGAVTVGRALLVSTPIFLTFGGLFFAADAVFAVEVKDTLAFDLHGLQSHVFWTGAGTWIAASMLWSGLAVPAPPTLVAELPESRRIKALETTIVLGPLALLFALFVVVQLRYLFGGDDAVLRSTSLTYAQYARHGFFELVIVSLLLLPVLTTMNWARRLDRSSNLVFGALALVLVVLLFVVMASACQRLSIYMDAFGLTELRLYSASILPWLAVLFVWFLVSVALRLSDRFFAGVLLTALVLLLVLNVVSPDAIIARANFDNAGSERAFDDLYTLSLSADAVPVVVGHLDRLDDSQRCSVAQRLQERWRETDDIRGWNWARYQAHREVSRLEPRPAGDCR